MKNFEDYKLNLDLEENYTCAEVVAEKITELDNGINRFETITAMFENQKDAEEFYKTANFNSMDTGEWDGDIWHEHKSGAFLFSEEVKEGLFKVENIEGSRNFKILTNGNKDCMIQENRKSFYQEDDNNNIILFHQIKGYDHREIKLKNYDDKNREIFQQFTVIAPHSIRNWTSVTEYNEVDKTSTKRTFINGAPLSIIETQWNEDFTKEKFAIHTHGDTDKVFRIQRYSHKGNETYITMLWISMDENPIYKATLY